MPMPDPSPTLAQLRYLRSLSDTRGVSFLPPRTRAAASRQIAALKAIPAGRTERRIEHDASRSVTVTGQLAAIHDDEIDGYGATCRWSGAVEDN